MVFSRIIIIGVIITQFANIYAFKNGIDSLICEYNKMLVEESDSALYKLCFKVSVCSKEPDVKLKYARLANKYVKNVGSIKKQAASKVLETYPHMKTGKLDEAIFVLLDAKKLYTEINFTNGVATCRLMLANIYEKNKEYKISEHEYIEAIDGFFKIK